MSHQTGIKGKLELVQEIKINNNTLDINDINSCQPTST